MPTRRWPASGGAQRDGRTRPDGTPVRAARSPRPPRRPAGAEADPAGDRARGHERRPTGRATRPARNGPSRRPLPASRRCGRTSVGARAAAGVDADRPARPGPRPRLPRPPAADARGGRRAVSPQFGKFHDHTLGQIAAFEPSYMDWLAGTVDARPGHRCLRRGSSRRTWTGGGPAARHPSVRRPAGPHAPERPPQNATSPPDTGGRS